MKRSKGFSILELLVVLAIVMTVVALSTPAVLNSVGAMRLRTSAAEMATLIQETRMLSVRDNKFYTMRPTTIGGNNFFYVDLQENSTYTPGIKEELVEIASTVKVVPPSQVPAQLSASLVGGTSLFTLNSTDPVSFNSRGLPCLATGATPTSCSTLDGSGNQVGFVYYMATQQPFSPTVYKAVSVTPAGRVRIWTYDGASWS